MSEIESFWGEIPTPDALPDLPNRILKEQGSLLTEATDGALIGETVFADNKKQSFSATLRIKVPSLNNYFYNIVRIEYPIEVYPVDVVDMSDGFELTCKDLEELRRELKGILSSDRVRAVISALLAQVSANNAVEG